MFDRFLVKLTDGTILYTTSFDFLLSDKVSDIIRQERTFDNGMNWKEVTM